MVESKSVIFQMIPHTLFIEWDFWTLFITLFTSRLLFMTLFTSRLLFMTLFTSRFYCSQHCSLAVVLFMTLFTSRCEVTIHIYDNVHVYVLFTYMVLFIRPVFFFKCSFLDLFKLKFYY